MIQTFTFKVRIYYENSNRNTFIALYSSSNVTTKTFRINNLEQIRTCWFRLFVLIKSFYSYGKR